MDSIPDGLQEGMPLVEVGSLADDAVILDVRDAGDWRAGHAPGAVNIPLAQLISRLTELPVPPTGPLAKRQITWIRSEHDAFVRDAHSLDSAKCLIEKAMR